MPVSISDHFGIDPALFDATGAFDAILDVDSRLFIDPFLLKESAVPELRDSYKAIHKRFQDLLKMLAASKRCDDIFWSAAKKRLSFHEVKGLCIGYSAKGTSGLGMGEATSNELLTIAKEIIEAGIQDPEIFELVGLLQNNVGADLISDMVANIILSDLLAYSERICAELGMETEDRCFGEWSYKLLVNPFNRRAIILVPRSILRDLPISRDWTDRDVITTANRVLRDKLNAEIGGTWKQAINRLSKDELRSLFLREPDLLRDLISTYRRKAPAHYNFESDPAGEVIWYRKSNTYVKDYPIALRLPSQPTAEDVLGIVMCICAKFRDLVENNALSSLLYSEDGKAKHEGAAQKLFYGIADAYCAANNLDLTGEANGGRGPVDFKVSRGYRNRVLVETKLTSNNQLMHGFEKQIQEYQKAEKTTFSVYVVVDVLGGSQSKVQQLRSLIAREARKGFRVPHVVFVDAIPKLSASKYR